MTLVAVVCLTALSGCAATCLFRLWRAAGLSDRALAFDTATAAIVSAIAVFAAWTGNGIFADIALILGLLGFLSTVAVARYLSGRGQ